MRALHVRVGALQEYITGIPGESGLKDKMAAVCALMPLGRGYDAIVADVRKLLPETIDDGLREVKASCASLGEPWKTHIVREVGGILSAMALFRVALLMRRAHGYLMMFLQK